MRRFVAFQPAVNLVPVQSFSKLRASQLHGAWEIVGPSAYKNLNNGPVWTAIAAAYLEGLNHGAALGGGGGRG